MPYPFTVLIEVPQELAAVPYEQRKADHDSVVAAYVRTFEKRAFEENTANRTQNFLNSLFQSIHIRYPSADPQRHILIWDLLNPFGNEIIDLYAESLSKYEYSRGTVGESLRYFLDFVRVDYLKKSRNHDLARRNYVLIVVAVTSGVRATELCHLDVADIRFDERRIWVRFGKGYKGSGKRQRLTILTDFAAQTLRVYLKHTRPVLARADAATEALFLTQHGKRMTYGAMREALDRIVDLAKETQIEVPNSFGWHDQRRSFTTGNAEKHPEKLIAISRLLGHTGLGTIHRYIRPSKRTLSDAAKKVAAELSPTT